MVPTYSSIARKHWFGVLSKRIIGGKVMDLAISYSALAFLIFTTHITYYDVIYDVM